MMSMMSMMSAEYGMSPSIIVYTGSSQELIALGWRAVPVTIVAGRAVKGFDKAALTLALEAAAAPPPDR